MKNLSASLKAKLLNIARKEGRDFNRVLLLYIQERFMARLARSKYQDHFILKGGVCLYLRYRSQARPTVDLDLLGRALSSELSFIADIMRELANTELEDGVRFDSASVRTTRIRETANYEGVRVKLTAYLESARVPIQIDVGFGDVLTPRPVKLSYPRLLDLNTIQPSTVLVYAVEAIVAEKFQAMVVLGILNSRLKDFYDLYIISQRERLEASTLNVTIEATFKRRVTSLEDASFLFKSSFAETPALHQGWTRLRTANPTLDAPEDFSAVMKRITKFLAPIVTGTASGKWQPVSATWVEIS